MHATERQKWNTRHLAGEALASLYREIEPKRRHEINDTMVAAAARVGSTAAWFEHVWGRFGVALEACHSDQRLDIVIARLDWQVLREAVEENPALLTMIAKNGPLPDDLGPAGGSGAIEARMVDADAHRRIDPGAIAAHRLDQPIQHEPRRRRPARERGAVSARARDGSTNGRGRALPVHLGQQHQALVAGTRGRPALSPRRYEQG